MDYQLYVYPSSERDMKNIKSDNATKQIKIVLDGKIQQLYKKTFGPAIKTFNERATSGRLIEDYYKSICSSNIPEVYKLQLIIRYELLNKTEINAIVTITTISVEPLLFNLHFLCLLNLLNITSPLALLAD